MSKEGVLAFDEFRVSSPGIGSSGPVAVWGTCSDGVWAALSIQAFGQTRSLSAEQLESVAGCVANSLQLSCDTGHMRASGATVYVLLSKGFTSGRGAGTLICFSERRGVQVLEAPGDDPLG